MAEKILLPNDCSMSTPSVNPSNWDKGGRELLEKNWQVQYYFYDPKFKDTNPYGKLIAIRGMNSFKTLAERRRVTRKIIAEEIELCRSGYNHFLGGYIDDDNDFDYEINPDTPFIKALWEAVEFLDIAKSTKSDVKVTIRQIERVANKLRFNNKPISEIKRRNVIMCLNNINGSNYRYNKNRSHLRMLFKQLVEFETINYNIISDISKKVVERKQRDVLTKSDFQMIAENLKQNHYMFFRFCMIFFHAGIRATELFSIKKKHVSLIEQEYKVLVKKGKQYVWETKVIILPAISYWREILNLCNSDDDFLFSKGLLPGSIQSRSDKGNRYWKRHVKTKLGITADFYTMKHLFLDLVDEYDNNDFDTAKEIASHKSSAITDIYRTGKKKRMLEVMKKLNVSYK